MSVPLQVCLDARLISGVAGGVEQAIIGLAGALSRFGDGDEEYSFLVYKDADHDWLQPYVHGPCRLLPGPAVPRQSKKQALMQAAKSLPVVNKLGQRVRPPGPPASDGTVEKAGIELMHFTTQHGFLTSIPSIYQPWDLQHVHLPHLFTQRGYQSREINYRVLCEQADLVVMASTWGQRDVIQHFHLADEKVQVVPIAPVLEAYPIPNENDFAVTRRKFSLPIPFAFYPAQTWPHKNHEGLLQALALLRDRDGLKIALICSGRRNAGFPPIERRMRALRLEDQVQFLDFVSALELQCLYKLCRCMIFPTRFEGWGLPVTEAFMAGAPVACSNVTSLPALAGDAALLFDPDRPEEIANALHRLWTDDKLRGVLRERGRKNVARFSWDRTARLFRAHYRRLAKRPLSEEDQALLAAPPLI